MMKMINITPRLEFGTKLAKLTESRGHGSAVIPVPQQVLLALINEAVVIIMGKYSLPSGASGGSEKGEFVMSIFSNKKDKVD